MALPPSAEVIVTFPMLFDMQGTKVLPTYVSHVITSSNYQLANIHLRNTGGPAMLQVSIDLPTYGVPTTRQVSLAPGQTTDVEISPTLNYATLFQNTTALPATLVVSVKAGTTSIFAQSYPIQVTGRNTVFWTHPQLGDVVSYVSTMVTPQDKALSIQSVIRGAANRFPTGSMPGYQPASWPTESITLSPGDHQTEFFYVLPNESPSVTITSVVGGTDNNYQVFIMTDADYSTWAGGQSASVCGINTQVTAGTTVSCTNPPEGWYVAVYYNPGNNYVARTVARSRLMTKWEVTFYQSAAIFEELRARGLVYVNLPGTGFFASSQNVRYPVETLATASANCIDGSLVFASAWEALGMEPIIAISFSAGHAFAAVKCWTGSTDCVIPWETTLVGSTANSWDAYAQGSTSWNDWAAAGHLQAVDIKLARTVGLTPAPM